MPRRRTTITKAETGFSDEEIRHIRENTRVLMAVRGLSGPQLAGLLGFNSHQSFYQRLNGESQWKAVELIRLAGALDYPLEDLIKPMYFGPAGDMGKMSTFSSSLLSSNATFNAA